MKKKSIPVAIIMGSKTDASVMEKAAQVLADFSVSAHFEIVSAHRTPDKMFDFAKSAQAKGFKIIIAGAGGAAHLPGMVACLTTLPVIGVPIAIGKMKGLDALLSIAQMPKGIPVATVAVENAENAALLALRILGIEDSRIHQKLEKYQSMQKKRVAQMNREIRKKF